MIYFLFFKVKVMFTCTVIPREIRELKPQLDSTPITQRQMENAWIFIIGDEVQPNWS